MNPVCIGCKVKIDCEMRSVGVALEAPSAKGGETRMVRGDLHKCPRCGSQIVVFSPEEDAFLSSHYDFVLNK